MSSPEPQAEAILSASLERALFVVGVEVAAETLFIYDYFTTLDEEIDLVWRGRWGAGKILFLMSRYIMLPEVVLVLYYALFKDAPNDCRFTITYLVWSVMAGITIGEAILVLRTWAVLGTSRRVLVALVLLLCATTATNAYYVTQYMHELTFLSLERLDPSLLKLVGRHTCALTAMGRDLGAPWIAVAAFELIIFVVTAMKLNGIAHLSCRTSRLASSIYRDGTLYFICLSGVSVANVQLVYTQPVEYIILLTLMQGTLHSILTCRLILHIRAIAREDTKLALSRLTLSTIAY